MSEDVKELLGKAFGQEPPLGIDRDEVLQQGRKRLRRRRFLEAGSVVALVVVVAVGATTLTRVVGTGQEDKTLPPAASSTDHAPPGPDLPMTSSQVVPPPEPKTTTTHLPVDGTQTQRLTALLYAVGVINEKQVSPVPPRTGNPAFRQMVDQFIYEADLGRSTSRGYVEVVVDPSPNMVVDCRNFPSGDCEIKTRSNTQVAVSHVFEKNGERVTSASALSPAGVWVTASASNMTRKDRQLGRTPPDTGPVLTDEELCLLVTKAGLGG